VSKTPRSGLNYRTRLQHAADANMLIVARCNSCRRSCLYLASDLIEASYHVRLFVEELFGPRCPHCGSIDFFRVRERYANQ
jgi:hypothetical protein